MARQTHQFRFSPDISNLIEEEAQRTGKTKTQIVEGCVHKIISGETQIFKEALALLKEVKMDSMRLIGYLKKERIVHEGWRAESNAQTTTQQPFVIYTEGTEPLTIIEKYWHIEIHDEGTTLWLMSPDCRIRHNIPISRIVRIETRK